MPAKNGGQIPGWIVSKIFFFGFSWVKGIASDPIQYEDYTTKAYLLSKSGPSKYTLSPGLETSGGLINSMPASLPSLDVA